MYSKLIAFTAILGAAVAAPQPWGSTSSSTWKPTTSSTWKTSSTAVSSTKSAASPTSTVNNGGIFINKCLNFGISVADCTTLLDIAALNGNTLNVGGSSGGSSSPVNNGLEFFNECANIGISVLDCADLLDIALLNGNVIDIDLAAVSSLLAALGLPIILTDLLGTGTGGLVTLPTNILNL